MSGKGNETQPLIPDWLKPDAQPELRERFARSRAHNDRIAGSIVEGNPFDTTLPLKAHMPSILKKPSQQ